MNGNVKTESKDNAAQSNLNLIVTDDQLNEDTQNTQIQQFCETEKLLNAMGYRKVSIFDYLQSGPGQKLADGLINLLHGYQKKESKSDLGKIAVICLIIVVAGVLISLDKFDPSLAILMGTLAGYLFGKKAE